MPLQPLYLAPGICKVNSDYASGKPFAYEQGRFAIGRFIDGDKVRFVAGFPEKIGGWIALATSGIVGIPRALRSWRDNNARPRLGIGTDSHLYYFDATNTVDITPRRSIVAGTLSSPFTTQGGNAAVAVADSSQSLINGDWVFLDATSPVGGLTINGWYIVSGVTGSGYTITASTPASSSANGGGTTAFQYPHVTLTNPFTTTLASQRVTVAHANHGATTGDYVTFSGASAVGGLTISGEYQLLVVDANHYTIPVASPATSSATGGGSVLVAYDITMGTLTAVQPVDYGVGVYGTGVYGGAQITTPTGAQGWTLAAYGDQLLASPIGGTIYVYDPVAGGRGHALLNAPTDVLAMFVTPERFVFALGTSNSSLQMAWPDQGDYTNWTSLPSNTANQGRTVQGGSAFVGGVPVRDGVSLLFTDRAVFQANYSGDNNVYDTPLVGDNAGLVSPQAVVAQGENAFWMSDSDFWTWNGTVQQLPSDDIRDFVFGSLNRPYLSKSWARMNRAKKEVWFGYPSGMSAEVNSYVIYHMDQQCFSTGTIAFTAGEDSDLFGFPIAGDATGAIYQLETGTDAAGSPMAAFVTLASIDISNGTNNVDIMGFIPDFERLSQSITLTVNTKYYPSDPETANGPFIIAANDSTPRIDLRADGKMVGFTIESSVSGGDFRLGLPRVDIQPSGARR